MKYTILLLLIIFVSFSGAYTQTETTAPALMSLPKAEQPKNGYEPGGAVRVRVEVSESGQVTNAVFLSGPGPVCSSITRPDVVLARETALAAARRAKFTPAMSNGVAVASIANISVELPGPKPAASKEGKIKTLTIVGSEPSAGGEPLKGGVLNGKALSIPSPSYPSAARAVRASGAVQVHLIIDEDGNIFSAEAIEGHPLLRPAAVSATCNAKFSPTLLDGQPVRVSGIITYNFVP